MWLCSTSHQEMGSITSGIWVWPHDLLWPRRHQQEWYKERRGKHLLFGAHSLFLLLKTLWTQPVTASRLACWMVRNVWPNYCCHLYPQAANHQTCEWSHWKPRTTMHRWAQTTLWSTIPAGTIPICQHTVHWEKQEDYCIKPLSFEVICHSKLIYNFHQILKAVHISLKMTESLLRKRITKRNKGQHSC